MSETKGSASAVAVEQVAFAPPASGDAPALVPAVVQDAASGEVLMLAWQSRESLAATVATGEATFWSRSRKALWKKGETSGNTQRVRSIAVDCDADAVLLQVDPAGPACHTGERTCFYRPLAGSPSDTRTNDISPLARLDRTLADRRTNPPEGSYVAKLYGDEAKRHKKIGEEAAELIVASVKGERASIVSEAADLFFHTMVVLRAHGITLGEVAAELEKREGAPRRD
jgi:phosphoribosyl-ATP pyrophosphohydrolase/phosphoribosyl-AMP cyclohydrolase